MKGLVEMEKLRRLTQKDQDSGEKEPECKTYVELILIIVQDTDSQIWSIEARRRYFFLKVS